MTLRSRNKKCERLFAAIVSKDANVDRLTEHRIVRGHCTYIRHESREHDRPAFDGPPYVLEVAMTSSADIPRTRDGISPSHVRGAADHQLCWPARVRANRGAQESWTALLDGEERPAGTRSEGSINAGSTWEKTRLTCAPTLGFLLSWSLNEFKRGSSTDLHQGWCCSVYTEDTIAGCADRVANRGRGAPPRLFSSMNQRPLRVACISSGARYQILPNVWFTSTSRAVVRQSTLPQNQISSGYSSTHIQGPMMHMHDEAA